MSASIIAISGRQYSGKTLLADAFVRAGRERFSFATFLKETLSKICEIPLSDFYDEFKKKERFQVPLTWDKSRNDLLSKLAEEEIPFFGEYMAVTLRSLMEHVGTSVLRRHDPHFHIKRTLKTISDKGVPAVIDDMRFPNELRLLKSMGVKCLFIMRPFNLEYSNNPVESSVNWNMPFDHIIVNDSTKEYVVDMAGHLNSCQPHVKVLGPHGTRFLEDETAFLSPTLITAFFAGCVRGNIAFSGAGFELAGSKPFLEALRSFLPGTRIVDGRIACSSPFIFENLKAWDAVGNGAPFPYQIANEPCLRQAYVAGISLGRVEKQAKSV